MSSGEREPRAGDDADGTATVGSAAPGTPATESPAAEPSAAAAPRTAPDAGSAAGEGNADPAPDDHADDDRKTLERLPPEPSAVPLSSNDPLPAGPSAASESAADALAALAEGSPGGDSGSEPAGAAAKDPFGAGPAADEEPAATDEPSPGVQETTAPVAADSEEAGPRELVPAESRPEEISEPTGRIRVRYYGATDVGLVRDHNEDNFLVADLSAGGHEPPAQPRLAGLGPRGMVLAVCDGMGGAAAGEVASQLAVDTISEVLGAAGAPTDRDMFARRLVRAVRDAGDRIFVAAKMDRSRRGMGTTATVAGMVDEVLFVGQVGDSRAYVLRNGKLSLITKDQSLVNQLIEAGQLSEEEAEAFEHSNIILQALGTTEDVQVDLTFLELRRGDRLMLCSDGLSGLVHTEMIQDVMATATDLAECASRLIEMANTGGGHDNITVVCADFDGEGLQEPSPAAVAFYQQYPLPPGDDDLKESLPPRDASIKEVTLKPGADVKRPVDYAGDADEMARGGATGPMRSFNWWLIILVLVLAVVAGAVALAMVGEGPDEGSNLADPAATAIPEVSAVEEVEIVLRSDVDGELYIDGQRRGALPVGGVTRLWLLPGAYRFEARSGGSVVAAAVATVRPGVETDIELMMPSGAERLGAEDLGADDVSPGDEPVDEAPVAVPLDTPPATARDRVRPPTERDTQVDPPVLPSGRTAAPPSTPTAPPSAPVAPGPRDPPPPASGEPAGSARQGAAGAVPPREQTRTGTGATP